MARKEVQQGEIIDLTDSVTAYATDTHPAADANEAFEMHPKIYEYLLAKGYVTDKPVKVKADDKG